LQYYLEIDGIIERACIMGQNADRLQLSSEEMDAIVDSFKDKSETKAIVANGVHVNGVKYMTIEASDDSLKAKKVRHHILLLHQSQYEGMLTAHLGQGRRRRLQDHASPPHRPPP
jgi:hypothetical protein